MGFSLCCAVHVTVCFTKPFKTVAVCILNPLNGLPETSRVFTILCQWNAIQEMSMIMRTELCYRLQKFYLVKESPLFIFRLRQTTSTGRGANSESRNMPLVYGCVNETPRRSMFEILFLSPQRIPLKSCRSRKTFADHLRRKLFFNTCLTRFNLLGSVRRN